MESERLRLKYPFLWNRIEVATLKDLEDNAGLLNMNDGDRRVFANNLTYNAVSEVSKYFSRLRKYRYRHKIRKPTEESAKEDYMCKEGKRPIQFKDHE